MTSAKVPEPALATLSHDRFWEPGWVYERKLDGQRCLAVRDGRGTRLYSRSGRDVTVAFPEIAEALEEQAATSFVVDGEVVAFDGSRTSFARLQPRIHLSSAEKARRTGIPVYFYVFDVLEVDGEDVRGEPLLDRKRRLRKLLTWEGPVRSTPHRVKGDEAWFSEVCRKGWEGLIAKRADAPYAGGRTDRWLKFKCEAGQELVVVGWTDPTGSRVAIGALLLGYHDGDDLVYAGKVGTGFSQKVLRDLHDRLSKIGVDESPCTRGRLPRSGVHWVRPRLVAEVAFTEWTSANQLRHPRYLGLRTDKAAADVVREGDVTAGAEVAGVEISKPDKELFPASGKSRAVTKHDLAEYYESVAGVMLPHLKARPVNMQRFPDGIEGMSFYEKKVPSHFPDFVGTVEVHTADGTQRQVVVDSVRSLVYLAQQACLTPHTWLSRSDDLDRPDQLVFDLDPTVEDLRAVRRATRLVGELLDDLGLTSFVKTTGSRGYHVLVPLRRSKGFDDVRAFARSVAEVLVEREPDLLTLEARKDKRGERVLVDIQRNGYGQTAVPPYAVRARPGAPVSTPITWDELSKVRPDQHTIRSIARRLGNRDDPWKQVRHRPQGLAKATETLSKLT